MKQALLLVAYFLVFILAGILPIIGGNNILKMSIVHPSFGGFFTGGILLVIGVIVSITCIMQFWAILSLPRKKG